MESSGVHVCLETAGAPDPIADYELGTRWVCECGANFVFREGFNRAGYLTPGWWSAPAIPQPRRSSRSLAGSLFGRHKG